MKLTAVVEYRNGQLREASEYVFKIFVVTSDVLPETFVQGNVAMLSCRTITDYIKKKLKQKNKK